MNQEMIRRVEEARKLSDSEWECLKAKLLKEDENELEKKVYNILKEIGLPSNIKGYKYLKRAIILSYNDSTLLDKITTVLYPKIAKKYNTTWHKVERNIRADIEMIFYCGNTKKAHEIFKNAYSIDKGRPTNKQFISGIVTYIRNS